MFEQTFVNTHAPAGKPLTVAASLMLQTALVGALILIPLLHPDVLHPNFEMPVWVPMKRAVQKLEPAPPSPQQHAAPRPTFPHPLLMPTTVPARIARIVDAPPEGDLIIAGPGPATGAATVLTGMTQPLPERPPQPPPAPAPAPVPSGPIHVSTGVQSAKLLYGPKPLYPPLAKAARVHGTVKIQAIIASDGVIRNVQLISGPALLAEAALNTVKQWRYQPTLLNRNAVEVITEIDVVFTLSQ